jgi:hypothetical protein
MDTAVRTEVIGAGDQSWLGSHHGTNACRTITIDKATLVAETHYPDGYLKSGLPLGKITASGKYGPYGGRANEVQTINLGSATAGTITIGVEGETTAAIAYNATAAAVQTALELLSNVNPGEIVVTGGPLPGTITLTFGGRFAGTNVAAVTVTPTGLTGGTVTVATTTAGGSAVSDGRETLVGFLFTAQHVGSGDIVAPLLDHGRVIETKLPTAIDDAARTAVAGRIIFV